MFQIKDTLVSLDLIERCFVCDLKACKGQCCIDGDAGAPLSHEERKNIDAHIDKILPLLTPGGRKAIESEGSAYYDSDGDLVTTLIDGANCAFSVFSEDGTCLCALEKGYREGTLPNLKPSSCFLYPVRLQKVGDRIAVNLHKWNICSCAIKKGNNLGIRAYQFLKEPLIREFGEDWFEELDLTAREWISQNGRDKS